jgi:hypothetical protein
LALIGQIWRMKRYRVKKYSRPYRLSRPYFLTGDVSDTVFEIISLIIKMNETEPGFARRKLIQMIEFGNQEWQDAAKIALQSIVSDSCT